MQIQVSDFMLVGVYEVQTRVFGDCLVS